MATDLLSNNEYIRQLYGNIGRSNIDNEGLNYWTGLLDSGISRDKVSTDFNWAANQSNNKTAATAADPAYAINQPGFDVNTATSTQQAAYAGANNDYAKANYSGQTLSDGSFVPDFAIGIGRTDPANNEWWRMSDTQDPNTYLADFTRTGFGGGLLNSTTPAPTPAPTSPAPEPSVTPTPTPTPAPTPAPSPAPTPQNPLLPDNHIPLGTGIPKEMTPVGPEQKQVLNSQVDYNTETIEGRLKGLLGTKPDGTYSNPLVRQASDRAMAAFAQRGLLNSSMAQEAAMEAAISKAIEIAGPDADKYFQNRRGNVDWTNKFGQQYLEQAYGLQNKDVDFKNDMTKLDKVQTNTQSNMKLEDELKRGQMELSNNLAQSNYTKEQAQALQTNYTTAITNLQKSMVSEINRIQTSEMDEAAKTSAIAAATALYSDQMNLTTTIYSKMPNWSETWKTTFSVQAPATANTATNTTTFDPKQLDGFPTDLDAELTPEQEAIATAAQRAGYRIVDGQWVKS